MPIRNNFMKRQDNSKIILPPVVQGKVVNRVCSLKSASESRMLLYAAVETGETTIELCDIHMPFFFLFSKKSSFPIQGP